MIVRDVYELIGDTPLIELRSLPVPSTVKVYGKMEMMNPGGSVKDRLGMNLIERAMKRGDVAPGGTVIEPTAGNTGIGLALACQRYDIRLITVTPEKFSKEKQALMRLLGATVVNTPTELGMKGAISHALELAEEYDAYVPEQFSNPDNPDAYVDILSQELLKDVPQIDVFVAGAGSGGTFTGVAKSLKPQGTKTVVVEPVGSILNGGEPGPHKTEGIGVEKWPPFLERSYVDAIHTITDEEAFYYVAHLAKQEGLLIGSSSGAAIAACVKEANQMSEGTIVTILPDSAERYLSQGIVKEAEYAYKDSTHSRR
ncbi:MULTISPECIES: cysteine synthase family protein [unclassified Exiguobacterium]|uniref:PLP-dependent cysteine synthase family protein n=1 Tax=unclassified Exiguobacterium TaxID=2644629 RepID=UPI001BE55840|nr:MULTISPECIES: cysteine synthase family protein [unclassified Exiguobacterium]